MYSTRGRLCGVWEVLLSLRVQDLVVIGRIDVCELMGRVMEEKQTEGWDGGLEEMVDFVFNGSWLRWRMDGWMDGWMDSPEKWSMRRSSNTYLSVCFDFLGKKQAQRCIGSWQLLLLNIRDGLD